MKNKYNALQILTRVYRHTLKAVPFSGVSGILNYLVQGLFPAFTSLVLARLFDAAYSLTQGVNALTVVILYGSLFVTAYAVVYILQFISSITINAGIYERCTSYYNMKIFEKTAALPLISFENVEVLNLQNRAKDCADREILSQIYMSSTVFITSGISVISTKSFLIDLGNMPGKMAFANDYFEFLDLAEDQNGIESMDGIKEGVTLSNVSFAYPNSNDYALKNVSLTIHKGEKIVVLGVNGSGKTTLSKIILNIFPPSQGEVRYDSILSSDIDKNSLYDYLSVIPQNFTSYSLTLRENIAIFDLEYLQDDTLIKQSLELSGLQSLLNEVGSLDDQLGREFGGKELSGGQWQKLAIARGLFKASELIILDEPTSALDPLIETEILQQFIGIAKNKTAVIISHRVGLCKLADRIVVMKDGEVCEIGTHHELIEKDGEYRRLYTTQEQWYR